MQVRPGPGGHLPPPGPPPPGPGGHLLPPGPPLLPPGPGGHLPPPGPALPPNGQLPEASQRIEQARKDRITSLSVRSLFP